MGKCEECGQKHASCGLVGDEKRERRWCCACGKRHGAVNYGAKMYATLHAAHSVTASQHTASAAAMAHARAAAAATDQP